MLPRAPLVEVVLVVVLDEVIVALQQANDGEVDDTQGVVRYVCESERGTRRASMMVKVALRRRQGVSFL